MGHWGSWLANGRGNPSRWVALVLAALFAVATVAAALLGQNPTVITVLGWMFVIAFNTAFGRRAVVVQVAAALGRWTREKG
jgi:hypothetical protein